MQIVKELSKPKNYLPVVAGVTVGIVGGQFVVEQVKSYVAAQFPLNDMMDIAGRLGVTIAALALFLATSSKKTDVVTVVLNTAAIGAIGVGTYSFLAKLLQWQSLTISRVGRAAPARAARPMTVVSKTQTPIYRATPADGPVSVY